MEKIKSFIIANRIIFVICSLVVIGAITTAFVLKSHNSSVDTQNQISSTTKNEAVSTNKNVAQTTVNTTKGTTPSTSYTPPTDSSNITLATTTSGDQVIISTKLTGYSDGTCSLKITNGTLSIAKDAEVIYAPNYSTCAGFSISTSELGSGVWNIELTVVSGGQTTSKSASYQVSL